MVIQITTQATLNGGSIEAELFEDTDGDGTAENQAVVKIADGSTEIAVHTLDGGSGNDYWIRFDLEPGDLSETPVVDSASIDPTPEQASPPAELITESTLNGHTIRCQVFQDTDGDGGSDNSDVFELSGGTEELRTYATTFDSSDDYWIQFDLETGDAAETPVVDAASIEQAVEIIEAQAGSISSAGVNAGLDAGGSAVQAAESVLQFEPRNAGLESGAASISADAGSIPVAGQDAVVDPGQAQIGADAGVLQITAEAVERVFESAELAGTVTLNGDPVEGAEVYAIDDLGSFGGVDDTNTEPFEGVATLTDADGNYTIRVDAGNTYHLAYQHETDEGDQYNALSKPFLVP